MIQTRESGPDDIKYSVKIKLERAGISIKIMQGSLFVIL